MNTSFISKQRVKSIFLLSLGLFTLQNLSGQLEVKNSENSKSIDKAKLTLKESAGKIWFEENKGQMSSAVQYSFSTNFGAVYIENDAILFMARKYHDAVDSDGNATDEESFEERQYMRIRFEGGNAKLKVTPINPIVRNINYFQSASQDGFVYGVKAYSELYINDVYPGVDLRLYSVAKGQMEFDWVLDRGSDYSKIKMNIEGHEGIEILPNGGFKLKCRFQGLNFQLPESYQYIDGKKQLVEMKYAKSGENTLYFEKNNLISPDLPMVIDPTVLWATYFEQTGGDYLFASESDNCGRVYLAGRCKGAAPSSYIQGATGYDVSKGSGDVPILYIFSADGDSIKAFSYFGSDCTPQDMDLFPNGRVLVGGSMRNKNGGSAGSIPATTAGSVGGKPTYASYSTSLSGKGWIAIFDSEFSHLYYSSHMPGTSGQLAVTCLEIVDNNTYLVAGITDVNITSGVGTTFVDGTAADATRGAEEGYIVRFSGSSYNTRDWGTYVGGSGAEDFISIKLSSDLSKVTFAGNSSTTTAFPTLVNPVDNTAAGEEGWVGYLTNTSSIPTSFGLLSFLGGSSNEGDLLIESLGDYIYVLGYTNSSDFPGVTGISGYTAFQSSVKGDYDAFVSRVPFTGSGAATGQFRSTYFGGGGTDISGGIIFNTNDSNLYLFLTTGSISTGPVATQFPVKNTVPPSNFYDGLHDKTSHGIWTPQTHSGIGDLSDIVFATISPDLTTNIYTSYCGGSDRDYLGNTGSLAGAGHYGFNKVTNIYSLGTTIHSNDLGARGSLVFSDRSFDTVSTGGDDHFIVKFNLSNTDMGDAPTSYDGSDPARHGTNSLGLTVAKFGVALTDYDSKPEASAQADGDDNRNTGPSLCAALLDDEDGLVSKPILTVESSGLYTITYTASNATGANANVYAWIDLNGNGVFEANEFAVRKPTIATKAYLTNVSFTFSGSSVTATKTAHGLVVGDWIGFEGGEGNNTILNGLWQITSRTANTFTFSVGSTPAGTLSNTTVQTVTRDTLSWSLSGKTCPTTIVGGRTYIRMRITTDNLVDNVGTAALDERSRGVANTGEIEDHVLYIRGRDYGDLPVAYGTPSAMVYQDLNVDNIPDDTGAIWLGTLVDIEKNCAALYSSNADGDDLSVSDDEDGLAFPSAPIKAGVTKNFTLSLSRNAPATTVYYGLWFDWNADGDFTDPTDGFYSGSSTGTSVAIPVTPPTGVNFSPYFRVRAIARGTSLSSSNYNAVFNNGEVEDYINDPGILISGTVFDDGDGTYDAAGVDGNPGSAFNNPSGVQLWAYLINPAGSIVMDSIAVLADGTYFLQGALASTAGYSVRISTTRVAIGAAPPAVSLPTNWVSVGETYGVNNAAGGGIEALTPASNSIVQVNTGTVPVTALNFGIDNRPSSNDVASPAQPNPAGVILYQAPGLTGTDLEQGTLRGDPSGQGKTVIIKTLPGNADVYYNGVLISSLPPGGRVIANYDSTKLQVDPTFTGAGTVTFQYVWRDSAQQEDLSNNTITMPFTDPTVTVSGNVFDDGNGLVNSTVDGTGLGNPSTTTLYANLLNSLGTSVVATTTVNVNGTYTFPAVNVNTNYIIQLSINQGTVSSGPPATALPTNWVNTGENLGAGAGNDGSVNSLLPITVVTSNLTNANFGIDERPTSNDLLMTAQNNPGIGNYVAVGSLSGNDLEDGSKGSGNTIVITSLATNGTLRYNGVAVTLNQVITNYNPALLQVTPNFSGAGSVTFAYAWRDAAGFDDLTPANVEVPFLGSISGTVFDDGDGLANNTVDGTGLGNPSSTTLYANLISIATGNVVATTTVNANGTYSFSGLTAANYRVQVSTNLGTVGNPAPTTALPTNWVNTGENLGAGSGNDGAVNGVLTPISVGTTAVTDANFGIDERPTSTNVATTPQLNPGGTVQVQGPTLAGNDLEDGSLGTGNTFVITSLGVNGTIYYNGTPVTLNQVITSYDPTLLTVDPTFNGAGTVTFTYAWRDAAGFDDLTPATASIPFTGLNISGVVHNDYNGVTDNLVNGPVFGTVSTNQLWAYMLNASNTVVDSSMVSNTTGAFNFDVADANTTYSIVVSTTRTAIGTAGPSSSNLPGSWMNVGEAYGTSNNAGSGIEAGASNGIIAATTTTSDITNILFGIEYGTVAEDKTYAVAPDSITGLTGLPLFTHFIFLNHPSGTTDGVFSSASPTVKPGQISGYDAEEGRFNGATGSVMDTTILTTLPDTNNAVLVYRYNGQNILLWPTPSVIDPSWQWWNASTNQYEIPNLEGDSLMLYFKFAYQLTTSFRYAYVDASGLSGPLATYQLSYTVPLPVVLGELMCSAKSNGNNVSWKVIDGADLKEMKVFRSLNGEPFVAIATIAYDFARESKEFSYLDKDAGLGYAMYKVLAYSIDGTSHSTNVCALSNNSLPTSVKITVSPNPTSGVTSMLIVTPEENIFTVDVRDNLGRVLQSQIIKVSGTVKSTDLDLSAYVPGIYNVRISWNGNTEVVKVLKQ